MVITQRPASIVFVVPNLYASRTTRDPTPTLCFSVSRQYVNGLLGEVAMNIEKEDKEGERWLKRKARDLACSTAKFTRSVNRRYDLDMDPDDTMWFHCCKTHRWKHIRHRIDRGDPILKWQDVVDMCATWVETLEVDDTLIGADGELHVARHQELVEHLNDSDVFVMSAFNPRAHRGEMEHDVALMVIPAEEGGVRVQTDKTTERDLTAAEATRFANMHM